MPILLGMRVAMAVVAVGVLAGKEGGRVALAEVVEVVVDSGVRAVLVRGVIVPVDLADLVVPGVVPVVVVDLGEAALPAARVDLAVTVKGDVVEALDLVGAMIGDVVPNRRPSWI